MTDNPLSKRFKWKSILKFAAPNIIMMIFYSLYTIVDAIFISRLINETALSATNMYYPFTSLQYAISIMLSSGGNAVIAYKMGKKKDQDARNDFTLITVTATILGILFLVLGLPFLNNILKMLGVSESQFGYAKNYATVLLIFAPMLFLQAIFQMFFITAGKPTIGLILTVIGGISNMVFDYLFMGVFHMGTEGAAIATGIGFSVPAIYGLIYFSVNKKNTLYFTKFKIKGQVLLKTCTNGSSEMIGNLAIAITTFLYNMMFMKFFQEHGVAAITILSFLQFVFSSLFLGYSAGISPIIAYKYGAKDYKQLKYIAKFSIIFITISSILSYILSALTIKPILMIFTESGSPTYDIALSGFYIYALQFLFLGFSIFASSLFTALGNGIVSAIISVARTLIFLVASLLILPLAFGEIGLWLSSPLAELLGLITSVIFLIWGKKKYQY